MSSWTYVYSSQFKGSLRSAERSPSFKVVSDISSLAFRGQCEVILLTLFCLSLDIKVLIIVPANRLAFFAVERLRLFGDKFLEAVLRLINSSLMVLRVCHSKHFVVLFVDVKLHWVLVVSE